MSVALKAVGLMTLMLYVCISKAVGLMTQVLYVCSPKAIHVLCSPQSCLNGDVGNGYYFLQSPKSHVSARASFYIFVNFKAVYIFSRQRRVSDDVSDCVIVGVLDRASAVLLLFLPPRIVCGLLSVQVLYRGNP